MVKQEIKIKYNKELQCRLEYELEQNWCPFLHIIEDKKQGKDLETTIFSEAVETQKKTID